MPFKAESLITCGEALHDILLLAFQQFSRTVDDSGMLFHLKAHQIGEGSEGGEVVAGFCLHDARSDALHGSLIQQALLCETETQKSSGLGYALLADFHEAMILKLFDGFLIDEAVIIVAEYLACHLSGGFCNEASEVGTQGIALLLAF